LRRGQVVARQHDYANAIRTETGERRLRCRLDRICDGNNAGWPAADRNEHGRRSFPPELVGAHFEGCAGDTEVLEELGIANGHLPVGDSGEFPERRFGIGLDDVWIAPDVSPSINIITVST